MGGGDPGEGGGNVRMRENHIRILCSVIKTDLVYEDQNGELTAFFDAVDSPLLCSSQLRLSLKEGMRGRTAPFLMQGEEGSYFAALAAEGGYLYMGPMCHGKLTGPARKRMYRSYGVSGDDLRVLPAFTLPEIRNMILLTNTVLSNASLEEEELLQLNRMIKENEQSRRNEQMAFVLREEEEDDSEAFRHSYHEEQLLMQAIREGRTAEAIRLAESMDRDTGRLSGEEFRHRLNLAVVGIALCARAAIEGGVSPMSAYRISGYYIRKCDACRDPAHMLHYRNRAIEELSGRVAELLDRSRSSDYVERCKDYIRKHYREKLYLEEIARHLGISPGYLSKLFKKETGMCLENYITEERVGRAANMLIYSEIPLSEIALYVHFPNQSYFGKIFKQYKGMTPRAYRERYKNAEFRESPEKKSGRQS